MCRPCVAPPKSGGNIGETRRMRGQGRALCTLTKSLWSKFFVKTKKTKNFALGLNWPSDSWNLNHAASGATSCTSRPAGAAEWRAFCCGQLAHWFSSKMTPAKKKDGECRPLDSWNRTDPRGRAARGTSCSPRLRRCRVAVAMVAGSLHIGSHPIFLTKSKTDC